MRTEAGEGYAVNVPLKDGIDDTTYRELFRPIITRIMDVYQPDAVVFQCGASTIELTLRKLWLCAQRNACKRTRLACLYMCHGGRSASSRELSRVRPALGLLAEQPCADAVSGHRHPRIAHRCCAGADSLAGDKLGVFNISISGHADCLKFVKGYGLPMLVLGGGGYKISNVARCWAFETGTCLGETGCLPKRAGRPVVHNASQPTIVAQCQPGGMAPTNPKYHAGHA